MSRQPCGSYAELGEHGIRRTTWADLALTDHWRRFMADPDADLRHITWGGAEPA